MSPDLSDELDDGLDALPAGAVESFRLAIVLTAWRAEPAVHLTYDEDADVLLARIAELPATRKRHVHDDLVVHLDAAHGVALLTELRLTRFAGAQRSPAATRARELLGPTAWRRAVVLTVDGTGETVVRLDADERDVLLDRWARFSRPVTALGVQVLPEQVHGVLVDEQGVVLAEATVPLPRPRPDAVAAGVAGLMALMPGPIAAVCLQIGAPVDSRTGVVFDYHKGAAYADDWRDAELGLLVTQVTGMPVHLVNDVVALAVHERWFGLDPRPDRYGVLLVAEGIGGAVVRDGKPDPDTPMEFGHFVIHALGRKCGCGSQGCVEATAGTRAIVERITQDLGYHDVTDLDDAVAMLERTNDPVVRAVFREAGEDLAIGIGSAQVLEDLEAWFVHLPAALCGGSIADTTFRSGMEQFKNSVAYRRYRRTQLHLREATGRDGARGAGLAALERFGLSSVPRPRGPVS